MIKSWSRHAIPKTQDDSLGDSDQIHFTWMARCISKVWWPHKIIKGRCKVVFSAGNILKLFPIRIVHVLFYVFDEWILFIVFCSMFSQPWCLMWYLMLKDIWPHVTSLLMWPIVSGKKGGTHGKITFFFFFFFCFKKRDSPSKRGTIGMCQDPEIPFIINGKSEQILCVNL